MTTRAKKIEYPRKTIILLAVLASALLLSYAALTVTMVNNNYEIKDIGQRLTEAENQNRELRIRASEVGSLEQVLERSTDLSYTEIENAVYIQKPGDSPFAAR